MEDDMIFCPECGIKYLKYDTDTYAAENCPLIIMDQSMFIEDEILKGTISFLSAAEKTISACAIKISCKDQFGDDLSETIVKYGDLSVSNGETFGEEKIFAFTDNDTRIITIDIDKILYEDGSLQNGISYEFKKTDAYNNIKSEIENTKDPWYISEEMSAQADELWRKLEEVKQLEKHKFELMDKYSEFDDVYSKLLDKLGACDSSDEIDNISTELDNLNSERDAVFSEIESIEQRVLEERKAILSNISYIVIPDYVKEIPDCFFQGANSIEMVNMTDSVTKIYDGAFSDCVNLHTIRLSDNLNHIGSGAFAGCKSLKSIVIPASVKEMGANVFRETRNLKVYLYNFEKNQSFVQLDWTKKDIELRNLGNMEITPYAEGLEFIDVQENSEEMARVQIKQERIKREAEEKEKRFNSYWTEHAAEKESIEAEIESLNEKISLLIIESSQIVSKINTVKSAIDSYIAPSMSQKSELQNKISQLNLKLGSLGIFKGKEKAAVKEEISRCEDELQMINKKIEDETNIRKSEIQREIDNLKTQSRQNDDEISQMKKRIDELQTELTKER